MNSNLPYRWSPASLTFNNYFNLYLYLYITRITINNNPPHLKSPKKQNRRAAPERLAPHIVGFSESRPFGLFGNAHGMLPWQQARRSWRRRTSNASLWTGPSGFSAPHMVCFPDNRPGGVGGAAHRLRPCEQALRAYCWGSMQCRARKVWRACRQGRKRLASGKHRRACCRGSKRCPCPKRPKGQFAGTQTTCVPQTPQGLLSGKQAMPVSEKTEGPVCRDANDLRAANTAGPAGVRVRVWVSSLRCWNAFGLQKCVKSANWRFGCKWAANWRSGCKLALGLQTRNRQRTGVWAANGQRIGVLAANCRLGSKPQSAASWRFGFKFAANWRSGCKLAFGCKPAIGSELAFGLQIS